MANMEVFRTPNYGLYGPYPNNGDYPRLAPPGYPGGWHMGYTLYMGPKRGIGDGP